MPKKSLIPMHDDAHGFHVRGENLELSFATVDDLRIALGRALIDPNEHESLLANLQNGFCASMTISDVQWKAFSRR